MARGGAAMALCPDLAAVTAFNASTGIPKAFLRRHGAPARPYIGSLGKAVSRLTGAWVALTSGLAEKGD